MRHLYRSIRVLVLAFCIPLATYGQQTGLALSLGWSSHAMEDLHYLQEYLLNAYPVKPEITSSFSPNSSGSLDLIRQIYPHVRMGASLGYAYTGGKFSYADYSGELINTIALRSYRLGAFIHYFILDGERLDLGLKGVLYANLSTMNLYSSLYILGIERGARDIFYTVSPSITLSSSLEYKFRDFSLGLEGGYLLDMGGALRETKGGEKLIDPQDPDRSLTSDWSGWMLRIKAVIWLKRSDPAFRRP